MSGHSIVCGMGDVGYRIIELLHRLGEDIVVVTQEASEERLADANARGIRILRGDARNEQLLLEADLASARAVIASTDQDLVNIEIALDARRYRPDVAIVVRLSDPELPSPATRRQPGDRLRSGRRRTSSGGRGRDPRRSLPKPRAIVERGSGDPPKLNTRA